MTDCPRAEMRDLLPDLMHGRLDDVTRAMVEEHVANCDACADELALLRTMRAALATPPRRVDVAQIVASLPSAGRRRAPVTSVRMRNGVGGGAWRIAAGIALLAAAAVGYQVARQPGSNSVVARRAPTAADSTAASTAAPPVTAPATQVARAPSAVESAGRTMARHRDSVLVGPSRPQTQVADAGLGFAGGVSDLADKDVQELLDQLGDIESVPDADVSASLDLSGEGVR